jgi:cholinesterase
LKGYGIGMGSPTADDPHTYDEDCLGINIWTKPQKGEKAKAVLMWVYGGGKYALARKLLEFYSTRE